jgi:hypothetical protein
MPHTRPRPARRLSDAVRCLVEHYQETHPHQHLEGIWSKDHNAQRANAATLAAARRSFLGVNAVLTADPFDASESIRPKGRLKPCLAAGGNHEVMIEAKRALRHFGQFAGVSPR